MLAGITQTKIYKMKAISVEAVSLPNNNTGYIIDHSLSMKADDGIEVLESALRIIRNARNRAAQIKGYPSAKEAPKDFIGALSMGEILSLVNKDLDEVKQ